MKYLITGLGNIGEEYRNTRHNIGFTVLDALATVSYTHLSLCRLVYFYNIEKHKKLIHPKRVH